MMKGIYLITSPNGSLYIGESIDINRRWKNYNCLNCKLQLKLYSSFIKYGLENHNFKVIMELPDANKSELHKQEAHLIKFASDLGYKIMNLKTQGIGGEVSEETRKKLSDSHKGVIHSEETKRKMSESHKGKKRTDEHCKNLSKSMKGKNVSPEVRKKISASLKGRKVKSKA